MIIRRICLGALRAIAAFLASSQGCGELAGPCLGEEAPSGVKSSETFPGSARHGNWRDLTARRHLIVSLYKLWALIDSFLVCGFFFFLNLNFITYGSGGICCVPNIVLNYTALEQMKVGLYIWTPFGLWPCEPACVFCFCWCFFFLKIWVLGLPGMNYILLTLADIRYVVLLSSLMSEICTACGGGHLGWCCMQSVQGEHSECCYAGGQE